jgi:membrane associated rhomboid family serine protease
MSTTVPGPKGQAAVVKTKGQKRREGLTLLVAVVAVMWLVEVINTLDSNALDNDGIFARNVGRLWGVLTAPFIHGSFQHLIDNTIPFVFMGLIIALAGAARLAVVTAIVILIGGIGTWLIAPGGVSTIGASGVVFGYATYLLARGFFDRSVLELLTGVLVGAFWGGVLLASLVPQGGVSWEGHLSGAVGGVVAAYLLRRERRGTGDERPDSERTRQAAGALAK